MRPPECRDGGCVQPNDHPVGKDSRLPFPGYSVDGAAFADPVHDYLLTVDVSGASVGDEVTVRFLPPPFPVLAGSFVLAWGVAAAWLIVRVVLRRRGRSA